MFERFTERARQVVDVAKDLARKAGEMVGTHHLMLAILHQDGKGMAGTALMDLGITKEKFAAPLNRFISAFKAPVLPGPGYFSPRCKRALDLAVEDADRRGDDLVGTNHLVIGLMMETESVVHDVLKVIGVDPAAVLAKMESLRPRPKSVECRHTTLAFADGGFLLVCGNCSSRWAAVDDGQQPAFDARRKECNLGSGDIRKEIP